MKKAFTLVELLVVISIISLLMALSLPVMTRVREQSWEIACRSNLRQLGTVLKTYTSDNDGQFPDPSHIYHSTNSIYGPRNVWKPYPHCCRWHDARIGLDSTLMRRDHPELAGSLVAYLGNTDIVRCRIGVLANMRRRCSNGCPDCIHIDAIDIVPQYTYTMNAHLHSSITTGTSVTGLIKDGVDGRTLRTTPVRKETHVTRSPSEVFVFGEQNSWAINTEGRQPLGVKPGWAAPYELSGKYHLEMTPPQGHYGTIGLPALHILPTYLLSGGQLVRDNLEIGDAFATCHHPDKGDLNTGYSYAVMLDGHVEKVTVADQFRRSRRPPDMKEGRLGPGGNLAPAWPLDVPPPGGWDNQ